MVVKHYRGHGRKAATQDERPRGGWLFHLFMTWFARGGLRP
jgi:hypothetical protein